MVKQNFGGLKNDLILILWAVIYKNPYPINKLLQKNLYLKTNCKKVKHS